jgi:hypothetical protein
MEQIGHVFISHAARDNEIARRVYDTLKAAGIKAWLDQLEIRPGVDWKAQLDEALRSASSGLVLLSNAAVKSPEVTMAWRYFLIQNKPLYLASIEPVPYHEIPAHLRAIVPINLARDFDYAMGELIRTITNRDTQTWDIVDTKSRNVQAGQIDVSSPVSLTLELQSNHFSSDELVQLVDRLVKAGIKDIRLIEIGNKDAG